MRSWVRDISDFCTSVVGMFQELQVHGSAEEVQSAHGKQNDARSKRKHG